MHRQLPHSLAPLARTRALTSTSRSLQSRLSSIATPVRALSSYSISTPSSSTSTSAYSRSFSSSSFDLATFSPSLPNLAGRKKPGKLPEHEELDDSPEDSAIKDNDSSSRSSISSTSSSSKSSPPSSSSSAAASGASDSGSNNSDDPSSAGSTPPPSEDATTDTPGTSISKRSVPDVYPQVLALPITRRPLFPGFYKAVVIRDPNVVAAIKDAIKRGQPYIGAFLLKDENSDSDMFVFHPPPILHPVGVFAQITSTFPAPADKDKPDEEPGLTAVLYPHRRIRIDELLPARETQPPPAPTPTPTPEAPSTTVVSSDSTAEVSAPAPIPTEGEIAESAELAEAHPALSPEELAAQPPIIQTEFLHKYAVSIVNVSNVEMAPFDKKSQVARAIASEIISVFKEIAQLNPLFRDQIANFSMSQSAGNVFEEPEKLADFAAAVSTGEVDELQGVLESTVLEDRLQKALLVLKKELMNAQLQSKISKEVESKIQKRQREYYLMEQLKGIKKELGIESDGKDKLVDKFKDKAETLNMPEPVRKVFDEELNKLQHLEPAASEFNVTRNYLDWLTSIPWGRHSEENFDLKHAVKVLDEDHYGLQDVKDRILEFLAVGKLRGTVEGKILCFVGPPGVGKTSIGKSIARALDRQFFRFSVGGLSDVAEIKGHRRTYVGAMPGKIIQALKKVQTENPLVLIDEVDKIGRGHNGDPSSALLEMLDPEQNSQFLDHYVDVPVDLSRVLFVCTANTLDTIPAPLLDRMEVLQVSGYITEEKAAIASKYLAPQAKEGAGLKDADVQLSDDAVAALIRYYCRESGVRRLKQQIEKVYRKAALKIVQDIGEQPELAEEAVEVVAPVHKVVEDSIVKTETVPIVEGAVEKLDGGLESPEASPASEAVAAEDRKTTTGLRKRLTIPSSVHVSITAENLLEYVGPPMYQKDRLYTKKSPVGVSCGLGYLGNGSGAVMPIEVSSMPGNGSILLTGKLGEVIKESAQIALSFLKSNAFSLGLTEDADQDLIAKRSIHLHMPEGSIGKEGPSAGIAILTAFVSLFSKRGISSDLAMTGEMTLAGQVLPVGGLKEKILAAHRAGIKKILAPAACRADIEHNVPASVKEGIEIVYVENVAQVIAEAFAGTPIADRLEGLKEVLVPLEETTN
ncbi:ATP-dependent Lon protease, partial [Phenoliferia sp. Uapishka_3]